MRYLLILVCFSLFSFNCHSYEMTRNEKIYQFAVDQLQADRALHFKMLLKKSLPKEIKIDVRDESNLFLHAEKHLLKKLIL